MNTLSFRIVVISLVAAAWIVTSEAQLSQREEREKGRLQRQQDVHNARIDTLRVLTGTLANARFELRETVQRGDTAVFVSDRGWHAVKRGDVESLTDAIRENPELGVASFREWGQLIHIPSQAVDVAVANPDWSYERLLGAWWEQTKPAYERHLRENYAAMQAIIERMDLEEEEEEIVWGDIERLEGSKVRPEFRFIGTWQGTWKRNDTGDTGAMTVKFWSGGDILEGYHYQEEFHMSNVKISGNVVEYDIDYRGCPTHVKMTVSDFKTRSAYTTYSVNCADGEGTHGGKIWFGEEEPK